jgi:glycosyltransferase involved in cell wall biosynthesis
VWLVQRAEPTPHDNAGAQRPMRMGMLASRLAEEGHEVTWWTSSFDHYGRSQRDTRGGLREVDELYSIRYIPAPSYKKNLSIARLFHDWILARRFLKLAHQDENPPDVILASLPSPGLAWAAVRFGERTGVPVVVDVRDLWPDVIYDHVPRALGPLARLALRRMQLTTARACAGAQAIVGVTEPFVDWGVANAGRSRRSTDRAFHLGYLRSEEPGLGGASQAVQGEPWANRSPDPLLVVFFGTLGRMFDLVPVFDAARLLRERGCDIDFVICGDGSARIEMERQAAGLDNVLFTGWVDRSQIDQLLHRADVGLAPYVQSSNFSKNIPNKIAEYLSGGLVLAVSLDEGQMSDFINQWECGFSYGDSSARLADRLEEFASGAASLGVSQSNAERAFNASLDAKVIYGELVDFLVELAACRPHVPIGIPSGRTLDS